MSDITAIARVENTQLAAYGEREQVGEIVDRLMKLHPAAREVGVEGMRAVAQLAILVGASPLPATNEIHVWKNGNKIQLQLGINFYRRKAEQWGGVFWKVQPRAMTDSEREVYGIPPQQLAAIASAVKVEDMLRYKAQGFTANEVWDMTLRTGIGICGPGDAKNGRPAIWTAFKRAEVDLYRSLFPTQMATAEQKAPDLDGIPSRGDGFVRIVSFDGTEPDEYEDMTVDEVVNDIFFEGAEPAAHVDGDFEEVDEQAVEEAEAVAEPTAQESRIADLRIALAENVRPTIGAVASALAATGLYKNEHHAFQALKGYPDYPQGYKVDRKAQVKTDGALKLFDWGVARKSEEE